MGKGLALFGSGAQALGDWLRQLSDDLAQSAALPERSNLPLSSPGPAEPGEAPALDPILLAGWLWGDGHVLPGSVDETLNQVRPFNLTAGSRLLHLGAGLGTMSVAIAKASGCKVSGYERDPLLVAQSAAVLKSLKRVTVCLQGASDPRPSGQRWDHCFGRFALHGLADRSSLLRNCADSVLPGGHLSLVDYAADAPSAGLQSWLARQPAAHPDVWSVERWRDAFAEAGFNLRIEEDISARHRATILAGWHRLLTGRHLAGIPRRQLEPMVSAAERWISEAVLIESGALEVRRFYAIAPS